VKYILRRRPSPALVVACIALFVSLSGVSYGVATGFIDSREIRNNTIKSGDVRNNTLRTFDIRNNEVRGFDVRNSSLQGRDIAFNTLTGADIDEASLGKVASAGQADNAAAVGGLGVQKFFAKPPPGTAPTGVYGGAFFALEAGCTAGGSPLLQADGIAGAPATNLTASRVISGAADLVTDANLTAGDDVDLLGLATEASGTATVSTTSGAVATITYAVENAPAFSGENVCAIRGTVTSG
jgi:hypothetical protein